MAKCVSLQTLDEAGFFDTITNSWTRRIRFALKIMFTFALYIPLFYMAYFNICGNLLVQRNNFQSVSVLTRQNSNDSMPTVNFTLLSTTPAYFASYYNTTLSTLKTDMNCAKDNFYVGPYGDQVYLTTFIKSQNFMAFGIIGFVLIVINLSMKALQIARLDLARIMTSIKSNESNKYSKVISYVYV